MNHLDQRFKSVSQKPAPREPRRRTQPRRRIRWWAVAAVVVGGLLGAVWWQETQRITESIPFTNTVAATQNMRALATAQAQYHARTGHYAACAADLNRTVVLIAPDLARAFVAVHGDGEETRDGEPGHAQPKAGYLFQMLQGADGTPTAFWIDPKFPHAGMTHWAATARAVAPGVSGWEQMLITDAGVLYYHADAEKGDSQSGQFLIDAVPNALQPDGTCDTAKLAALGWSPYR